MKSPVVIAWGLMVAAVGWTAASPDIVSEWQSYGGDMEVAASSSIMVFCSCDVHDGMCNITMAAQISLDDEHGCHSVCGDRMACAYCHEPMCACSPQKVDSYQLCLSGNRADLFQCSHVTCTPELNMNCACDIKITGSDATSHSSKTARPPKHPPSTEDSAFHDGLVTGLGVGGFVLFLLVLLSIIVAACHLKRRAAVSTSSLRRFNTNSSTATATQDPTIKGLPNPTYERSDSILSGTYLYPYAPRLIATRQPSTSRPDTASTTTGCDQTSHYYQELTPRARDKPPTYEDSEGLSQCDRVGGSVEAGRERRQPVYMELVRPSDRCRRPPVDTFMY